MLRRPLIPVVGLTLLTACTSISEDFDQQLLRPPTGWLVEPADLGLPAERFEISIHSEASLTGWWIPHEDAAGRTVVLLHEEATNTSAQHPYYTFLHEAGFNVLTFDPRGFGKSIGKPSLRAWLYDLNELFDWLEERDDVDRSKIALFGTSLGSVAAMWAARTHRDCCAVVFEHLPSMREMLRDTLDNGDTALGAYSLGILEFSGLPENIEPLDNAPRVDTRGLFVTTEYELARNRKSLLRAYETYGGEKALWVVPATGRAPHAMLTQDETYRAAIAGFLDDAFAGRPLALEPSVRKIRDASDGEAWYEIEVGTTRERGEQPWAVEACAVLDGDTPRFARTWIDSTTGTVRIKLPQAPTHVAAARVFNAVADEEAVFVRRRSHLSRSGDAIAALWPRIEEVRNDTASAADCRSLAADLLAAAADESFHPTVEAELADVFAKLGVALEDRTWLERAVAAVPEHPERHFWPGPVPTYGYPQQDAVDDARRRLAK